MEHISRIMICLGIVIFLVCSVVTANSEIVNAHNVYRNEVGVVPISWSSTVATSAQSWANTIAGEVTFNPRHSGGAYGENFASGTAGGYSWTSIVNLWGGEKSSYTYQPIPHGGDPTTGHYTQIVWSTTTQCGCGKATHPSGSDFFVCQYNPPGNYEGQYPYPTVTRTADNIGIYRKTTHMFYLDFNGNGVWDGAVIDRTYNFGIAGDIPVVGKWDGAGTTHIGIWRNPMHTFYLDYNNNGAWDGALVDRAYNFGLTGDRPISGDWDNDGMTEIGVYRPSNHMFYLDRNGNGIWDGAVIDTMYNFGIVDDYPVTGNWNPTGSTQIGIFRQSTHTFYLDYNNDGVWSGAVVDRKYDFGITGDNPVPGDITGDFATEIGVFRPTTHIFYRDFNNNGVWNGALIDKSHNFGIAGDVAVTGKW